MDDKVATQLRQIKWVLIAATSLLALLIALLIVFGYLHYGEVRHVLRRIIPWTVIFIGTVVCVGLFAGFMYLIMRLGDSMGIQGPYSKKAEPLEPSDQPFKLPNPFEL